MQLPGETRVCSHSVPKQGWAHQSRVTISALNVVSLFPAS